MKNYLKKNPDVGCIRSFPISHFLGNKPIDSLVFNRGIDRISNDPLYYMGDDGNPSSIQVITVYDEDSGFEAFLSLDVANVFIAGGDIKKKPLYINEEILYEINNDTYSQAKLSYRLSYENYNMPCSLEDYGFFPIVVLPTKIQTAIEGRSPEEPQEPIAPIRPQGYKMERGFFSRLFRPAELKKEDEQYLQELADYEESYSTYKSALDEYKNEKNRYDTLSREEYVRYGINRSMMNYSSPAFEMGTGEVKKGPAESLFIRYLRSIADTEFELLGDVKSKHTFRNSTECYYYPDIALREKSKGLMIDVEIDEPYVVKSGKPIHYVNPCGRSSDTDRNEAMASDNWFVFRFTEEQIVRFPEVCYSIIKTICSGLLDTKFEEPFLIGFAKKKWSLEEARAMAASNYRQTYLPQDYQRNVYVPKMDSNSQFAVQADEELPF